MIQRKRVSKKMTQDELAAVLGVKRSTVSMWENGKSNPRAEMLPRIAAIFGCTIDELLCEDTDDDKPADPNQTTKGA